MLEKELRITKKILCLEQNFNPIGKKDTLIRMVISKEIHLPQKLKVGRKLKLINYILNQIGMIAINITLYYYKYYILICNINSIQKLCIFLLGFTLEQ